MLLELAASRLQCIEGIFAGCLLGYWRSCNCNVCGHSCSMNSENDVASGHKDYILYYMIKHKTLDIKHIQGYALYWYTKSSWDAASSLQLEPHPPKFPTQLPGLKIQDNAGMEGQSLFLTSLMLLKLHGHGDWLPMHLRSMNCYFKFRYSWFWGWAQNDINAGTLSFVSFASLGLVSFPHL